jgi:hypothetical protein
MDNGNTWDLPFDTPAELELQAEWGTLTLLPVEPGQQPRLELPNGTNDPNSVTIDKRDQRVRVRVAPHDPMSWLGGWNSKVTLYVPSNVRAHVQTNAGSVHVRNLQGCELGIKAEAGKIDLVNVHGVLHLSAEAGSIGGQDVGGYLNVETQAGSVRLGITELQPGEHRFRAQLGEIRLELARGMEVAIETHTSLGSVRNSYPSRPSAPTRLLLSTELGSLRVEEGGGSARSSVVQPVPPTRHEAPERIPENDPELERILKMVEAGELSAQEADDLLQAMGKA